MKRLVVIGAGPMGLEAALGALERGFDVTVLERDRVGASLLRWGAARAFSPLGMNVSARIRRALGPSLPGDDALLSGPEMVEAVLDPLADRGPLRGRIRTGCRVAAVGRARMTRRELPGHPVRGERPFRILAETSKGEEVIEADAVLDASGVYGQPAAVGAGGIPAPGERACAPRLVRHLGTLFEQARELDGRRVLLVGHGHSAANALALLDSIPERPRVTWATRSANRRPCVEVAGDLLPERAAVSARANDLASAPPAYYLTVERRASVEEITADNGAFDVVVGLTGYRPDLTFLSELALEISPVSEGAGPLQRALSGVTDCLSVPEVRDADLRSGEPGFALVGAKSYGRLSTFLLRTGRAQLERVLDQIGARA
jgi:NADPH-dependent 2,4-dienoyl-CoA reductase/sulfur reductase-like enzyme